MQTRRKPPKQAQKPSKPVRHIQGWICANLLGLPFATISSLPSWAGAWPQPAGETLVISKLAVSEAERAFDAFGKLQGGAGFKRTELEAYTEHGWRESVTLLGKASWQDTHAGSKRQRGLASLEGGARARLWTFEDLSVLSIQASVILPGRNHSKTEPLITSGHADYDVRLLNGEPHALFELPGFTDMQLAYRHRGGGPADEIRLDFTYGFRLSEHWMAMAQSQSVTSIGVSRAPFTSYRSQKFQLSLQWQFAEDRYVELGALRTFSGAQIIRETGGFVSLWTRF